MICSESSWQDRFLAEVEQEAGLTPAGSSGSHLMQHSSNRLQASAWSEKHDGPSHMIDNSRIPEEKPTGRISDVGELAEAIVARLTMAPAERRGSGSEEGKEHTAIITPSARSRDVGTGRTSSVIDSSVGGAELKTPEGRGVSSLGREDVSSIRRAEAAAARAEALEAAMMAATAEGVT